MKRGANMGIGNLSKTSLALLTAVAILSPVVAPNLASAKVEKLDNYRPMPYTVFVGGTNSNPTDAGTQIYNHFGQIWGDYNRAYHLNRPVPKKQLSYYTDKKTGAKIVEGNQLVTVIIDREGEISFIENKSPYVIKDFFVNVVNMAEYEDFDTQSKYFAKAMDIVKGFKYRYKRVSSVNLVGDGVGGLLAFDYAIKTDGGKNYKKTPFVRYFAGSSVPLNPIEDIYINPKFYGTPIADFLNKGDKKSDLATRFNKVVGNQNTSFYFGYGNTRGSLLTYHVLGDNTAFIRKGMKLKNSMYTIYKGQTTTSLRTNKTFVSDYYKNWYGGK